MRLSRRSIIRSGLVAAVAPALDRVGLPFAAPAIAQSAEWRHGISLFDDVKYPAGFKHFDSVNPNAPKGGVVRLASFGTFDNFNLVVAGLKGRLAIGVGLMTEALMIESGDEVSTSYGLLAEGLKFPADFSSVTYRLRPQARWHDGKPVTPADVIFSFDVLKAQDPKSAAYYKHVVKAEQSGEHEITFVFDGPGNRELPSIVGQLTVLPKHWWEGNDASGKKRDILQTSLEPPLGSGSYKVKNFEVGRRVVYERVANYWGKDVNVNIGRNNFEEVRYEYFRDLTVALEAFKGDQFDFRFENSAKDWATGYDFPAVKDKRVILEEFPIRNRGLMQAYVFNTRRDKFKDPRVRRAFNYAYDFEEMNKQLMFGQYTRISSFWQGCELASSGLPQGLELEILGTVRDKVPPEVFTAVYTNPVNGTPEAVRNNLREALRLLREAGYEVRNQRMVNVRTGEPFVAELLVQDPSYERFIVFFKPSLERLGINISLRIVDGVQYEYRTRSFDFDMLIHQWPESLSPGNEQRDQWGSESADRVGSDNLVGIKNPAVDALIERVIFATHRDELVAATRALDRVLLWNHYVVPQYGYSKDRTARWDRFRRPDPLPIYPRLGSFPTVWWWDADKAAKVGARR
jgi:microcin C transport system substrate-binding protein